MICAELVTPRADHHAIDAIGARRLVPLWRGQWVPGSATVAACRGPAATRVPVEVDRVPQQPGEHVGIFVGFAGNVAVVKERPASKVTSGSFSRYRSRSSCNRNCRKTCPPVRIAAWPDRWTCYLPYLKVVAARKEALRPLLWKTVVIGRRCGIARWTLPT